MDLAHDGDVAAPLAHEQRPDPEQHVPADDHCEEPQRDVSERDAVGHEEEGEQADLGELAGHGVEHRAQRRREAQAPGELPVEDVGGADAHERRDRQRAVRLIVAPAATDAAHLDAW